MSKRRWNKNHLPPESTLKKLTNEYAQLLATHVNPSQPYGAQAWVAALARPLMGQVFWPPTTMLDPLC
jgi:hypothetical protein